MAHPRLSADSRLTIIVTGLIAQHPKIGGMAWHYAQYAAGLSKLGHDVYYFEDSGEWPYTDDGGPTGDEWIARDCCANLDHLNAVLSRWGLDDRWAYRFPLTGEWFGLGKLKRDSVRRSADLLINVSGTLEFPHLFRDVKCLAYIDSDPVFTQSRYINGTHKLSPRVDAHDVHFSFGERINDVGIHTGHRWLPTRQPIVLSEWRPETAFRDTFTTVMNWTSYDPALVHGVPYGQKDREFARFIDVAKTVDPIHVEVAMSRTRHTEWEDAAVPGFETPKPASNRTMSPHEMLTGHGWGVVDSNIQCGDPDGYRNFIETSKGEWSVAKEAYAAHRPGWFSERSACYLAAGRPVVVQDTGFGATLPVGEGIVAFRTFEGAVDGLRSVDASYGRHSRAAREIAEEYFDSSIVLENLIDQAFAAHV